MRLSRAGRIKGLSQVSGKDANDFVCKSCILGKGKRLPAPSIPIDNRSQQPLSIVHIDLWGPATTPSFGGCRYFLTCYDCTRKIHLSFLKQKSDAFTAMMTYIAKVERQLSCKVKSIRSDNGGEFNSAAWNTYMQSRGIEHVKVPPAAHAQNGRVERLHLTILNGVRTVLAHSGLGAQFWAEAANYIAYTRNRTPCGPQHLVPDDSWRNKESRLDHLQPFGCQVFYRDHRNPSKLAPRYKEGLLMGFVDGTHNYRIWDTKSNSVITSRDFVFTHHSPTTSDIAPDVGPEIVQVPDDDIIETTEMPVSPQRQLLRQFSRIDQQETLRPIPDNIDDDDPLNLQPLDEGGIDPRLFSAHALLASTTAPQSYLQARHSGEWEQWEPAMQEELAKMDKYKVWEVVPRSPDMRVVGARWVYTRKTDGETGKPSAYKALACQRIQSNRGN